MKDANTNFRDSTDGDATATEDPAGSELELHPSPIVGHAVIVHVPKADGTSPTLDITFEESDSSGGTFTQFATLPQITAAGTHSIRLQNRKAFVQAVATIGGTSPDFGEVHIGVDMGTWQNDLQLGDNL